MSIEYDEKGKFYTDVITKLPTKVLIQTSSHLVRGSVHVREGERLKDELEHDEDFLAVTNANVLGADDQVLYSVRFMAIKKTQIVWVMPADEKSGDAKP
jgi:hypothetical protein